MILINVISAEVSEKQLTQLLLFILRINDECRIGAVEGTGVKADFTFPAGNDMSETFANSAFYSSEHEMEKKFFFSHVINIESSTTISEFTDALSGLADLKLFMNQLMSHTSFYLAKRDEKGSVFTSFDGNMLMSNNVFKQLGTAIRLRDKIEIEMLGKNHPDRHEHRSLLLYTAYRLGITPLYLS
jgi:hypothetical protein